MNQVLSSKGSSTPLVASGILDVPEEDSICNSLLVELKVLSILNISQVLSLGALGTYINFCSFPTQAFSFFEPREENVELKVSMASSTLKILRVLSSRAMMLSKRVIL